MSLLRNRYVRCAIGAIVAVYAAPKINNLLNWTIPELTPGDGVLNELEYASIVGIVAGMTSVALAAAFGAPDVGGTAPAGAPGAP